MKRGLSCAVLLVLLAAGAARACPCGGCRGLGLPAGPASRAPDTSAWSGWQPPRSIEGVSGYNNECRPSLSADGRILCFHADAENGPPYHPSQVGEWASVYWARWIDGRWDSVMPIDSAAGCGGRYPFITPDGQTIYLQLVDQGQQDIYVTRYESGHWTPAEKVGFPVSTDTSDDCYPSVSADCRRLYFASNRHPRHGARDLFVAKWTASGWDSVENLGPNVNWPNASNWNPFVTADGSKLYFSREHYSQFGPQELWYSEWTGTEWGIARNVGAPLNGCVHICSSFQPAEGDRIILGGEVSEGGFGSQDLWIARAGPEPVPAAGPASGTWQRTAGLDSAWYVHCLAETRSGAILAGTGPFGRVYRTTDEGATWTRTASLPGARKVYALLEAADSVVYAGTYPNGDVFRSTDEGASWTVTAELGQATTVSALLEDGPAIYAATFPSDDRDSGYVFRTTDGGTSWNRSGGLPKVVGGVLSLTRAADGAILAGCYSGIPAVYRSTDGGTSWQGIALPTPVTRDEWTQVWFIEPFAETVYAGGWVHSFGGLMWRSTDHGLSWDTTQARIMNGPVKMSKVYDLVRGPDQALFAGYQPGRDSAVFMTTDGGAHWSNTGAMPGAREALCLLRTRGGTILAGTTANGDVFKYQTGGTREAGPAVPAQAGLAVTSPVGPGQEARFCYALPANGHVSLEVYGLDGRVVRTLVDNDMGAGRHAAVWDRRGASGSSVPAGVYFCRLAAAGCASLTRKLLLL